MKAQLILIGVIILLIREIGFSQNVGINTTGASPNASSLLDIDVTPGNSKGLLIPRVTFAERTGANFSPLAAAAQGLLIYQTDAGGFGEGFYYNTSTTTTPAWVKLFSSTTGWSLTGNAGTTGGPNFLGTTDNISLRFRTNNIQRMIIDSLGNVGIGTTVPASTFSVGNNMFRVDGTTGHIGLANNAPTANDVLYFYKTYTNPSVESTGLNIRINHSGSVAHGNAMYAIYSDYRSNLDNPFSGIGAAVYARAHHDSGAGITTATNGFVGVLSDSYLSATVSTSINSLAAFFANEWGARAGSGTITNAYGLYISTPITAGAITNAHGIYINNITGAGTSNYSIYSNGGTNYFGGNVGIGTVGPSTQLHTTGGVRFQTLTGAGTRFVVTDLNGNLSAGSATTAGIVTGSGTLNYVPKWTPDGATLDNSSIFDNGSVGMGTTSPEGSGLTINQGANDNIILSLKSSDIAHGVTGRAETSTYAFFQKANATTGGLYIEGIQTQGTALPALEFHAGATGDITKSSAGRGMFEIDSYLSIPGGGGQTTSDANIFALRENGLTRFIINDEGSMYLFPNSGAGSLISSNGASYLMGGSVGIGTASPVAQSSLTTAGGISVLGSDANWNLGGNRLAIDVESPGAGAWGRVVTTAGGGVAVSGTNIQNAAYFTVAGNVGIGTTAPGGHGSGAPLFLDIYHASGGPEVYLGQPSTTDGATIGVFGGYNATLNSRIGWMGIVNDGSNAVSTNGAFSFYTANAGSLSEKVRITKAGNVGIGTTVPGELLSLGLAGTTKGVLSFAGNTSGKIIIQPAAAAGTYTLTLPTAQGGASTVLQNDGSGNLSWGTAGGSGWLTTGNAGTTGGPNFLGTTDNISLRFRTNNIQRMIIDSSGNVGIGEMNPDQELDVKAPSDVDYNSNALNSGNVALELTNPTSGVNNHIGLWFRTEPNGENFIYSVQNSSGNDAALTFGTRDGDTRAERMRITSTGNVGIGTTSPAQAVVQIERTAPGGVINLLSLSNPGTTAGTAVDLRFSNNGVITAKLESAVEEVTNNTGSLRFYTRTTTAITEKMRITTDGNVGIGCTAPQYPLHVIGDIASSATVRGVNAYVTGAITACSDIRYKKDITVLPHALDNILKLRGVNYTWKKEEFPEKQFTDEKQIGVIAQELEKIYPELVLTDKDGYKSVDYSRLTPVLLEAIKEQQKIIESLQLGNKNSELKIKNSELKIEKLEAAMEKLIGTTIKEEAKK